MKKRQNILPFSHQIVGMRSLYRLGSDNALRHHRLGDLLEARDVRARHIVALAAVLFGRVVHVMVDVDHDVLELGIHFLERPEQSAARLRHLERTRRDAARICSLSGKEHHARLLEHLDALERRGHIGALTDVLHAVCNERLCGLTVDLVLRCAGKRDVAGDGPDALAALVVLGALDALRIHLDARTLHFLDLLDDIQLDACLVVDIAVGVVHRNDLGTQALRLLAGVDGDVARAGDDDRLALEAVAAALERLCRHIDEAVARRLGARKAAAVGEASARQHADVLVADALVLTEEEADLSAAHAGYRPRERRYPARCGDRARS